LKRWELALQELLQVKADPFNSEETSELAYYLGLCYTKLGRYDDGLLYLEQVVTSAPDPLRVCQCRMTLAYIYVMTKRSKLAEFELSQLIKSGFISVQIYSTLAYAAWVRNDFSRAIELYEKALELDEQNTTALNGVGFILVDTDQDLVRGLRLCRRAVDMKPQNPAYLDSLGWAYYKTGDLDAARMWLHRAMELAPQEAAIRNHVRVVIGKPR
jgi:tetratricopeptide (TPR) repeat protein